MRLTRGVTIWLVATRTAWRISTTFEIQGSAPSLPPLAARDDRTTDTIALDQIERILI